MTAISHTRAARSYYAMLSRCNNPKDSAYANYGGRGIKVCDRWLGKHGLSNFISDMGDRDSTLSIDRIDNNSGYSPQNCVWSTRSVQARNRRPTRNKSGEVGVIWSKWANKWHAYIKHHGKQIHIGYFDNFNDAVIARRSEYIKRFGE